ncbi:unnamed protein product [Prunus armeniaca]|uniref:Uncharacterized protein n=1 Tax=Prunus armeniaca TaxID=36596 RepID=A0A6J5UXK6_PRUAR|nr:unnamed protein product [Prunus armeniaca]
MKIVLSCADGSGEDYKLLPSGPASLPDEQVPISHNDDNVYWKELLMIVYVWVAFLIVQIVKVPFAVSVTLFEANSYAKDRVIASKGKEITNWKLHQIFPYCSCGIVAVMMGSLLGWEAVSSWTPFLELGIPTLGIVSTQDKSHGLSLLSVRNTCPKILGKEKITKRCGVSTFLLDQWFDELKKYMPAIGRSAMLHAGPEHQDVPSVMCRPTGWLQFDLVFSS